MGVTDLKHIDQLPEHDIDEAATSDPDGLVLEDCDMSTLEVVLPKTKQSVSIRVDRDVLAFFRSFGKGYQTRMNAVLRAYMLSQKGQ